MPFDRSSAPAIQIALHVLHDHLPDRSRGSVQRTLGHRQHRARRPDGRRDRHRRVRRRVLHERRGARASRWGPSLGLLFGVVCGALFASVHAAGDDHVPGRSHRVRRRDQPGRDRAGEVPVARLLRARRRNPIPGGPHLDPIDIPLLSAAARAGSGRAFEDLSPVVLVAALLGRARRRSRCIAPAGGCGCARPARTRRRRGRSAWRSRRSGSRASCSRERSPGLAGAFLSVEVVEQLARGTDARARVHRPGRADPVELEPDPADGRRRSSSGSRRRSRCGWTTRR